MDSAKPTGYTVTIDAETLVLLLSVFGSTSPSDRIHLYGHSKSIDDRASLFYSRSRARLKMDGYEL